MAADVAEPSADRMEAGDWVSREFFSAAELRLEPEEYVARHAHLIGLFSFHLYRFADRDLGAWVRRVGELLASPVEVERCRRRFLSPEEAAAACQSAAEGL